MTGTFGARRGTRGAVGLGVPAILLLAGLAPAARAQLAPHIINQNELGQSVRLPNLAKEQVPKQKPPTPSVSGISPFVLRGVRVEGATTLPPAAVAATWRGMVGHRVGSAQLSAILIAIGRLCQHQGLALYSVSLPQQNFAGGQVVVRVIEGHVGAVTIEGNTKGASLGLLKHYAARIVADQPLHRATLERNLLLMQSIPGLKVGSELRPMPGQPGVVRLLLGIHRRTVEAGFDVNNAGDRQLDIVQGTANVTVNGLFRQGERDQLVFGAPARIRRYQYYGIVHQEPIGTNGTTVTVTMGELLTHPVGAINSGTAQIASVRLSDPLIYTQTRQLDASVEADYLNSNEALLGQTAVSERTRTLREGLIFARAGDWNGIDSGSFTVSEGINALGARRGSLAYGGPGFTKFDVSLVRLQALPKSFFLTVRANAQYALNHLPGSEQFLFGGSEFGRAYPAAVMAGDSGIEMSAELSHKLPLLQHVAPKLISGLAAFGYADWGRIWNRQTIYQYPVDTGASAGGGVRMLLLRHFELTLGAGNELVKPREAAKLERWRFLFAVSGRF